VTSPRSSTPVAQRRLPFGVRLAIWGVVGILLYYVFLVAAQYFTNPDAPDAFNNSIKTSAQQVSNALVLGAIYALVALGYTMVYGIIELINFAHGDVFMMGAFLAVLFAGAGAGSIPGLLHLSGPITNPVLLVIYMAATLGS